MTLWAFVENDCFPLLRWLCDRSPVLEGSSKPYVIHAIKKMQTPECGTGPWEAFPTLLIVMTGTCFLHRRATSMQVDKIQTGNNKCNNNNNKSKGSCWEKKRRQDRPFALLFTSYTGTPQLLGHRHASPCPSRLGQMCSAQFWSEQCRKHLPRPQTAFCPHRRVCSFVLLLAMWQTGRENELRTEKVRYTKRLCEIK